MNILVAEDNPTNQILIKKLLGKAGYAPVIVENGLEVLEELEKNKYNLVFMDLQMPEMDGIECTRKIKEIYGASSPVIIALTADSFDTTRDECMAAGMDGFLSKPFNMQTLLDLIQSHTES